MSREYRWDVFWVVLALLYCTNTDGWWSFYFGLSALVLAVLSAVNQYYDARIAELHAETEARLNEIDARIARITRELGR